MAKYVDGYQPPEPTSAWIIGNGFDLNIGVKSAYKDFLASTEFESIANNNSLCTHLSQVNAESNWIDIESEIAKYASSPRQVVDKAEFTALKDALTNYIAALEYDPHKHCAAAELIQNKLNKNCIVYNFNYTNCFAKLAENRHPLALGQRLIHPHGSAKGGDIVFGIGDSHSINPGQGFLYKASHKGLKTKHLINHLRNCKEIVIFGHSLGEMDHMYFQLLFDNLYENTENIRTLHFYPYKETGHELLHEQLMSISRRRLSAIKSIHNFEFHELT